VVKQARALRFLQMPRLVVGFLLLLVALTPPNFAYAGCYCVCIDGQIRPSCTSATEIPPICSIRTCPFSSGIAPRPLGSTPCQNQRVCDIYGHCVWKYVCPGDAPSH
jgi:hypothetical protein